MKLEIDQELLEAFLDDALTPEEAQQLSVRLLVEPALAEALSALRQERAVRDAVWHSLEPDAKTADQFASSVIRAARRERIFAAVQHWVRNGVAAAACIVLGVATGWYVWGRPAAAPPSVAHINTGSDTHLAATDSTHAGPYQVAITDQDGNVVAVQKFNRLDEASEFAQDLGTYQERRLDVQDGKATLVSDHF